MVYNFALCIKSDIGVIMSQWTMIRFFAILIPLLFSFSIIKAGIEINSNDSGIEISILYPEFRIERINENSIIIPDGDFLKYSTINIENGLPHYEFTFAIPSKDNINISYSLSGNLREIEISGIIQNTNEVRRGIEFIQLGSQRGVNIGVIRVNPFEFSGNLLTVPEVILINIDYGVKLAGNFPLYKTEDSFFAGLINKEIISKLPRYSLGSKSEGSVIFSENEWYNPDKEYLKLTTTKDATARISLSELIEKMPSLKGKEPNLLHLIHKGENYPLLVEDENGVIDESDYLIFNGKLAKGDTTYLDSYTKEETFYLYLDELNPARRLSDFPDLEGQAVELNKIRSVMHHEEDHKYEWGSNVIASENVKNEGWYWSVLFPGSTGWDLLFDTFDENIYLDPYPIENEDMFSIKYRNIYYSAFENSDSRLLFLFNNQQLDDISLNGFADSSLKISDYNTNPVNGLNNVQINSEKVSDISFGLIGIDYIRTDAESYPSVYKGTGRFKIATESDSRIQFYGFSSESIYAIDESNSYYKELKGAPGTSFRGTSVGMDNIYVTLVLNDSSYVSKEPGLHTIVLKAPEYTTLQRQYFANPANAIQFLNSVSSQDALFAAYNGPGRLPGNISDKFSDFGSENPGFAEGYSWIFASVSGQTIEKVRQTGGASFSGFLPHQSGKSFAADIEFKREIDYDFIIHDEQRVAPVMISNVNKTNLKSVENQADVIYISHELFSGAAARLAQFHSQRLDYEIKIVDVEDVYKEFSFGKKSPHAIKDFLKYTFENWQKPAPVYVGIWGDASWDNRGIMKNSVSHDFIPGFGNPVSDYWFGLFHDSIDSLPDMKVSRIPVNNPVEAEDYVDKVIEYTELPPRPWMKEFLLITGGGSENEQNTFFSFTQLLFDHILNKTTCADTNIIRKFDPAVVSEKEAGAIRKIINEGAIWTNFIGHGSAGTFEIEGWNVDRLKNKGRHGIFSTLSCNTGAFAEPTLVRARNESYVLEKDVGMIAAFGSTSTGVADVHTFLMYFLMETMLKEQYRYRNLLDMLYQGKKRLMSNTGVFVPMTIEQYGLLGDPLLEIKIYNEPELFIVNESIEYYNENDAEVFTDEDNKLQITGELFNSGIGINRNDTIWVRFLRNHESGSDTIYRKYDYDSYCKNALFEVEFDIKGMPGEHNIEIEIDPANLISEFSKDNNKYSFSVNVIKKGLLPLDPFPYWSINPGKSSFRFINPFTDIQKTEFQLRLTEVENPDGSVLVEAFTDELTVRENYIEWDPGNELLEDNSYWVHARILDINGQGLHSGWLSIPFTVNDINDEQTGWSLNRREHLEHFELDDVRISGEAYDAKYNIDYTDINYKIIAVNGITSPEDTIKRWTNIEVGNSVFTDSEFARGFNIIVYPSIEGAGQPVYRRFDTWEHEEASLEMIEFLKDSVDESDYVLIGTCEYSFRAVNLLPTEHPGSLDSLKAILKYYGSLHADSLDDGWSFAMLGRKGASQGEVPEQVTLFDTARVDGSLRIYKTAGEIHSGLIGPASEWDAFSFNIDNEGSKAIFDVAINIHFSESDPGSTVLFSSFSEANEFFEDLSGIDANKFPYISFNIKMQRETKSDNPGISGFKVDYSPLPELSVVDKGIVVAGDNQLRGNDVDIEYKIENISKRISAVDANAEIEIIKGSDIEIEEVELPVLTPGDSYSGLKSINTTFMDLTNKFRLIINPEQATRENYYFNNEAETVFNVIEDTENPEIRLLINGKEVKDYDYISINPLVEVELWDNSPLVIDKPEKLEIQLNSVKQNSGNTGNYFFESFPAGDLKARISFIPDTLTVGDYKSNIPETGDNLFKIFALDATGNRDTLRRYVNVSLNSYVENLITYPNPSNGEIRLSFDYVSIDESAEILVSIFDSRGKLIRQLNFNPVVGENEILWDGKDTFGNSLASGIYHYFISAGNGTYIEPITGLIGITN